MKAAEEMIQNLNAAYNSGEFHSVRRVVYDALPKIKRDTLTGYAEHFNNMIPGLDYDPDNLGAVIDAYLKFYDPDRGPK